MTDTKILLNDNATHEEKCKAAHNIIINYELALSMEQILLAFKKVLEYLHDLNVSEFNRCKCNRIFLFNEILNIDKNMYIALILALCDNLHPEKLYNFIIFKNGKLIDIGLSNFNPYRHNRAIESYYKLLNYYEFDVSNILEISDADKQLIQAYCTEKYACKSTKLAIKK